MLKKLRVGGEHTTTRRGRATRQCNNNSSKIDEGFSTAVTAAAVHPLQFFIMHQC